jgi:hypothetical protein
MNRLMAHIRLSSLTSALFRCPLEASTTPGYVLATTSQRRGWLTHQDWERIANLWSTCEYSSAKSLNFGQVHESQITAPSKRAATVYLDAENIAKTSRASNDIGTKSCLTLALAGGGLLTHPIRGPHGRFRYQTDLRLAVPAWAIESPSDVGARFPARLPYYDHGPALYCDTHLYPR